MKIAVGVAWRASRDFPSRSSRRQYDEAVYLDHNLVRGIIDNQYAQSGRSFNDDDDTITGADLGRLQQLRILTVFYYQCNRLQCVIIGNISKVHVQSSNLR